ncbi:helix-hairpin-helix domain-containing protein [Algoriphagus sp. CAU 1675]|uniref:ComEA family DNA-binding protein n=1 Tax=Algoriphagus sp. CAU 1675 TaxID=3032597 RepID=UPI0023DB1768|nr:helix-hairpin-helix domain-containing protein [Algoriphagus sp. CAU 1675]
MDTARSTPKAPSLRRIPFSESDSITLQIVPGVGPALASRIIKFRENLGGFQDKSQLGEIYGLKADVIEKIWDYFDFDPGIRQKIKVNLWDVGDLAKHPYIGFGEAKVLVAFRTQHGPFQQADDLLKIKIFDREWVRKISPYLDFDDGNSP